MCGRDELELERQVRWLRMIPDLADAPLETLLAVMRTQIAAIIGTPDDFAREMGEYADAGVEEFMVQWFATDDIGGLALIAERVLPRLSGKGAGARRSRPGAGGVARRHQALRPCGVGPRAA